MGNLHHH
jgi:seryl-tRNA synthetase